MFIITYLLKINFNGNRIVFMIVIKSDSLKSKHNTYKVLTFFNVSKHFLSHILK